MTELNINDVVSDPLAQRLGEAVNKCNDTAKRRMLETLKSDQKIFVGKWAHKFDDGDVCGCLIMDGVFTNTEYLKDEGVDVDDIFGMAESEDELLPFLYRFYGYDLATLMYHDELWVVTDPTLHQVSNAFDTFVRAFSTDYLKVVGSWDVGMPKKADPVRQYGLLTDDGRKAVLAVFHKYVTVPFPETGNDSPQ
jgi:hypothetical protein